MTSESWVLSCLRYSVPLTIGVQSVPKAVVRFERDRSPATEPTPVLLLYIPRTFEMACPRNVAAVRKGGVENRHRRNEPPNAVRYDTVQHGDARYGTMRYGAVLAAGLRHT